MKFVDKYKIPVRCVACGAENMARKHGMKTPYICRPCAQSQAGKMTWPAAAAASRTHGRSDTPLYRVWRAMKTRCENSRCTAYKDYGGRGIAVYWDSFEEFMRWADANGYKSGLEIDRIDNDGPYAPYNCRWVTRTVNARNCRNTRLNEQLAAEIRRLFGEGMKKIAIARHLGLSSHLVYNVLYGNSWR